VDGPQRRSDRRQFRCTRTAGAICVRTVRNGRSRARTGRSSLKEKLIKIGAKVISHGRTIAFPDGRRAKTLLEQLSA
jgi:hypothetical protein